MGNFTVDPENLPTISKVEYIVIDNLRLRNGTTISVEIATPIAASMLSSINALLTSEPELTTGN